MPQKKLAHRRGFSSTSPRHRRSSWPSLVGRPADVSLLLRTLNVSLAESTVHVLEEDDGSGWVKVADDSGGKGLVPASYIELLDGGQTPRSSTPSLSHQQTAQDYGKIGVPPVSLPSFADHKTVVPVRGVYAYKAQGPDELDVEEGKLIQLTDGPNGGKNYADGWWEGARVHGRRAWFSEGAEH